MIKNSEVLDALYVEQVSSFHNLLEISKALGISTKQLKTFIVQEEYSINKVLYEIYSKLTNNKVWLEQFMSLIKEKENILYIASIVDYMHPNLKQNPTMFVNALMDYHDENISEIDVMADDLVLPDVKYYNYLKLLSRYYGVSFNKLTKFITAVQKENDLCFEQIINKYKQLKSNFQTNNEIDLSFLNDIRDLKYKVSAILYNYPLIAKSTDSFMNSLLAIKDNEVIDFDITPVEDKELKEFIEFKIVQELPKKI